MSKGNKSQESVRKRKRQMKVGFVDFGGGRNAKSLVWWFTSELQERVSVGRVKIKRCEVGDFRVFVHRGCKGNAGRQTCSWNHVAGWSVVIRARF